MADETTAPEQDATTPAANDVTTGAEPGKQTETVKTFTQTELDAIVTERLQRAQRKAEEATKKATEAAQAQSLKEQGEYRALYEQEQAKRLEVEQRARALELDGFRRDVVARKNLPAGLAEWLKGETLEDLEANAEKLLANLPKPTAPNINAGDVSSKAPALPGGITEASLKEQAVRLGVPFEYFRANFLNGK